MSLQKLNIKSKEFSLPDEIITSKELGRESFVSKFPLDKIKDLTVDQYVQGTDKNSFCYWLEFKNILFGIGGGNASKFGVYKSKGGKYYTNYGKNKKVISGDDLDILFTQIKSGIIEALNHTANDEIDKIRSIEIPIWNMILQKILSIYYPNKFITIGSSDVLIECAKSIGLTGVDLKPENSIMINFECKNLLSSNKEYADWPYEKLGTFIWQTFHKNSKRNFYIIGSKYGENAENNIFPDLIKKSVVSTGFASHLNLENFYLENHSDITKYLSAKNESSKSYSALKHFLSLKVGDRVAIKGDGFPKGKTGFLSILGIAEVIEKDGKVYRHEPNGLGHLINVKFIHAPVYKEFDLGGYGRTIHKLSKAEHLDLIFNTDYSSFENVELNEIRNLSKAFDMQYPLNIILYGPPGTGKTYNSINYAVAKVEGKELEEVEKEPYKMVRKRYKVFVDSGQIVFTTFHQSMSYEDFIEGIKPVMDDDDSSEVKYEIRDGIFKRICVESKFAKLNLGDGNSELLSFDNRYSLLLDNITESNDPVEIELKTGNMIEVIGVSDKGNLEIKHKGGSRSYIVSKQRLEKVFIGLVDYENVSNLNKAIRDIIGGSNASAYWAVNKYLHELSEPEPDDNDLSFTYEQKKKLVTQNSKKEKSDYQNYVLIIDEINRGNIAQIFGELITLLEPNKRAGKKEALETILPYSQEKFSVPSNLYVVGTMNTADRSVEALDTALRRRFSFVEMPPKPEIIAEMGNYVGKVDIVKMLNAINSRIERLLDKDHCIGHSYFLEIKNDDDLRDTFRDKVIPLLEEYFFGDLAKIGMVLGQSFVEVSSLAKDVSFKSIKGIDSRIVDDYAEKIVFRITSENWDFQEIYA